jgi:membrane-bound metal-dependent hydrolase YbcI (DUF457 family)
MAMFRTHVQFSSVLGVGYAAGAIYGLNMPWPHAAMAGALCGVSGMLPDLDSDGGIPIREIFGVTAAAVPFVLHQRLITATPSPEGAVVLAVGIYLFIRYGVSWVFKHLTAHRGMFHSIPAALIAGEIAFLVHDCPEPLGRWVLAGGVLLGFFSHLLLDEIYSVDGVGLRLKSSFGTALKLASPSTTATIFCWLLLTGLTYLVAIDQRFLQPPPINLSLPSEWLHGFLNPPKK